MAERAYTVREIDALREACERRYLFGTTVFVAGAMWSRNYTEADKVKTVEEQLRTYMIAGITAEDIIAEDQARIMESACAG